MRPLRKASQPTSFSKVNSFWPFGTFLAKSSKNNAKKVSQKTRAKRYRRQYRPLFTLIGLLFLLLGGFISWWMDYPQKVLSYCQNKIVLFSSTIGLKIDQVFVEGRVHSSHQQVLAAVQAQRGQPILAYNIHTIQQNLEKLNWIKSASVQRRFPNILYVQLTERQPIALWQHQQHFYLVDQEGIVIAESSLEYFQSLPIVAGTDAPVHSPKILALLEKFPQVREKLSSLVRIRQRRWDLKLENSIQVKLPEEKLEDALARLSLLIEQKKITSGDVSIVDLRIPKQITLRLTPAAAVRIKVKGKET